jgi:16S rRNA (cytidine1402-2'-O)-methyltransferase
MSICYIIATPIGNLEDISLRALRVLKEVDLILCEDTRQTQKLLFHYKITKPTLSYHQHSKLHKINYIIGLLKDGKKIALVSDAGTPGISDPGNLLIEKISERFKDEVAIIPIPGACSAVAALSICGYDANKFLFMGYPPIKNKRKKFFEEINSSSHTVVLYESPYRFLKTLAELNQNSQIVVCRELTKKFESIYRGSVAKILKNWNEDETKGEFVIVVSNKKTK